VRGRGGGSDKHARGAVAVLAEMTRELSVHYTKPVRRIVPRPRFRWQMLDARVETSLRRGDIEQPITLVLHRAHLACRG